MKRILVAGVGNIFLGDDAFGVEVAHALAQRPVSGQAEIRDFGIRGYDLAYALVEGYEAVILVDAVHRGEAPGTVYLIEPDLVNPGPLDQAGLDAHCLDPVQVLQFAETLGPIPARVYLVGCEPESLDDPNGRIGLSETVQVSVGRAVELVESLLAKLLETETVSAGNVPANQGGM